VTIDITASLGHDPQESNRHGREDAQALLDASIHERQVDQIRNHKVFFFLDGSADFRLETVEYSRVSQ